MTVLGLDTSNYTTSAAFYDGSKGRNTGLLLEVPEGMIGLRQSDALFQHVKRLPVVIRMLREAGLPGELSAVCASTRPREIEGSYMPCFLAGESAGRALAEILDIPFYSCSHQQGHIAAAAWSADHMELLDFPHLSWHLSGGTTELLLVEPDGKSVKARCVGGTSDISAGQLIDRTGKLLGLKFPAGKALDHLAKNTEKQDTFTVKLNQLSFSLSGVENKIKAMAEKGEPPGVIARYALETIALIVYRTTEQARRQWPGLPVLCSGGVASNSILRERLTDAYFAKPEYSADNAMGCAVLGWRIRQKGMI